MHFPRKIKTRIALSFSLLFLVVAVPAIIYALNQVNLFFEETYLEQMRASGLAVAAMYGDRQGIDYDSLTARLSRITSSSVFLISPNGDILFKHYEPQFTDTAAILSFSPLEPNTDTSSGNARHKFISIGLKRYLQVQVTLPGGERLLQVKSLSTVSMLMVRMREVIIWSSFLGLLALVAVAFWVSANITRPLEELTVFAQRIRTGHLPEKIEIRSPDEAGDLADALNDIVENLGRARTRVAHLETMRKDFFANVSEQLKRPLLTIQDHIQTLMESDPKDLKAGQAILQNALSQSRSLERIIDALIQISKLEFGEASLEFRGLHVDHLLRSVADSFRSQVEQKGLQFEVGLPEGVHSLRVVGDEQLLKVALGNLVSNAVDYTDKGFIRIGCDDEGDRVKITVEDSGCGVPQDQIDRIFERFFRVNGTHRRPMDKAGLGLAITRHIIDVHEQKLEVESTLGIGSKFSFRLKKHISDNEDDFPEYGYD